MTVNDLLAVYHQRYIRIYDAETGKDSTFDMEMRTARANLRQRYGGSNVARIEADADSIENETWTMLYVEV